jgi:O-antigen/teichoic acid export membrane protein
MGSFAQGRPGWGGLRGFARSHSLLLTHAGALALGTLATAFLGFFYWWWAARTFSPTAVGLASAAISMMNLLGHVGEIGLGPFLIGQIPRVRPLAGALIATALTAAVLCSVVVGLAYVAVAGSLSLSLSDNLGSASGGGLFVIGVVLTGFTLVLDQALVGLLRSELQMWRNIAFAASKLALLLAVAALVHGQAGEVEILGTWVVGQICSIALLGALLARRRQRLFYAPRVALLSPVVRDVLDHHVLNIVLQLPSMALPFVVAVVLSPDINAAFYAGWTLVNVSLLVPASLTAILFSTGGYEPALFCSRLRLSLAISLAAGLATGMIFLFGSSFILGLFNPAYRTIAGDGLVLLGFGSIGVMLKYHYVALRRLQNRMRDAARILAIGSLCELAAAALGGQIGGLSGLVGGWLAAVLLQGLTLVPSLWRSLRVGLADGMKTRGEGMVGLGPPRGDLRVGEIA